jgi:hypothetical protein
MTPTFRTFLAVTLGAVAVAAAERAATYQTGAQWLVVVALVVAFVVAVCAAGGAVWGAVSMTVAAVLYERRLARRDEALERLGMLPPSARHARPIPDPLRVECDEYWDTARQASTEAELAPVRDGWTVPIPIVVVDAQPWPWSAPVAEPIGRGR